MDRHLGEVVKALDETRFAGNTVIIFTSDHGDLLGAHGGLFQKWYMAYEEALRVPLTVVLPGNAAATSVSAPTSHIDLALTILGLAGIDMLKANAEIAAGFTDALPLVGRDLSPLLRGETKATALKEPIYFITDDDPSRGLDQKNFIGLNYDSVAQPNHVETVIAEFEGEIWKYSRYFDHPQYWRNPGTPGEDGVWDAISKPLRRESTDECRSRRIYVQDVKVEPVAPEFEMYNVSADPAELDNLAGVAGWAEREAQLSALLANERVKKRLTPQSGPVPGAERG